MVVQALERNPLFVSAVLPKQVFPPLFNRYDAGMTFGAHVDNAIRGISRHARCRSAPTSRPRCSSRRREDYDGGELTIEDTYGSHAVKLPAGDMIVYPGTSLHNVTPITRGSRIASFFWTQSLIRDDHASARCCSISTCRSGGSPAIIPSIRASCRSPRSITTCCGNGPRCEERDERGRADAASDDRIP